MAAANNKSHEVIKLHKATAYDWEAERNKYKDIQDDGTMSFFWQAHTILVLVIFSLVLVYVTIFEDVVEDSDYNMKRGIIAMLVTFLAVGVTQTPDGPLKRPHPAFWRLILCLSIAYELALVWLLFQTVNDARKMLTHFDPELGKPLEQKNYGGNCLLYDVNNADPYHNIWDKMDGFVTVHFFGWWLKTLILRDWWLCTVLSVMFELLEYTLEHQLPNFSECWWDHWIMDAVVCNGLGIYMGMKTLNFLSMKPYHWRGMWNIPTYRGKMKRLALQFTPYSWTDFDWKPLSSLKRWLAMIGVIGMFLLAELNTFYLKFVLWIAPPHWLNLVRLTFYLFMGATAMRETFQYLDDPNCKQFGRQSWILAAIIITEILIVIKFDFETISKPLPTHIAYAWILGLLFLIVFTVWKFYIYRDVKSDLPASKKSRSNGYVKNHNESRPYQDGEMRNFNLRSRSKNAKKNQE